MSVTAKKEDFIDPRDYYRYLKNVDKITKSTKKYTFRTRVEEYEGARPKGSN